MALTELSDQLTYYAFKHSQGEYNTVSGIFNYFAQTEGLMPNLHPDRAQRLRYGRFIANGRHGHIQMLDGMSAAKMDVAIDKEFAVIREDLTVMKEQWSRLTVPATVKKLATALLRIECVILEPKGRWRHPDDGGDQDSHDRRLARLQSPQLSFLYYYGRDAKPEGHGFEPLYADMWQAIESQTGMGNRFGQLITRHEVIVADAMEEAAGLIG